MTRKSAIQLMTGFVAGIFGVSKAQTYSGSLTPSPPPQWNTLIVDENYIVTGKYKSALANQCPVCGTMAEIIDARNFNRATAARCLRCNAAFWQDPEPKK